MSKDIFLRKLQLTDVNQKYVRWLNDKKTNRYTEQRYFKHNIKSIKNYVKDKKLSKFEYLYGIFILKNKKKIHLGNLKIGPINFRHKFAEISYLIGNKS